MITINTPEKTWVRCTNNGELRFITKHNVSGKYVKPSFEDDGKVSDQPATPRCYYENYRPLTAEELNDLLTHHIVNRNKKLDWIAEWPTKHLDAKLKKAKEEWGKMKIKLRNQAENPEYTILEFKETTQTEAQPYLRNWLLDETSGNYRAAQWGGPGYYFGTNEDLLVLLSKNLVTINRVRRNSDNSVWTVGDEVLLAHCVEIFTIKSFYLQSENIFAKLKDGGVDAKVKFLKKPVERKPLFVTEDGKEFFNGDTVHIIDLETFNRTVYAGNNADGWLASNARKAIKKYKYFSSKEAAEEYIWKNHKQFSFEEISLIFSKNHLWEALIELKKLAKERINIK